MDFLFKITEWDQGGWWTKNLEATAAAALAKKTICDQSRTARDIIYEET